jgi:hypothetical protein
VSEYAGEVVPTEEAQRRWRDEYDRAGLNYLLVVREFMYALCFPSMIFNRAYAPHTHRPARGATLRTNIDGTRLGNVSRFFNHSCDPNMMLFLVRVGSLIPRCAPHPPPPARVHVCSPLPGALTVRCRRAMPDWPSLYVMMWRRARS